MRKTSLETGGFTEWVGEHLSDDALAGLQRVLLSDADCGDVMPGCGGLRKLRIADPRRGKGKRGAARVIYLHVVEADVIVLIDAYGKDEQDDLTAEQKKILNGLADRFKRDVVRQVRGNGS